MPEIYYSVSDHFLLADKKNIYIVSMFYSLQRKALIKLVKSNNHCVHLKLCLLYHLLMDITFYTANNMDPDQTAP